MTLGMVITLCILTRKPKDMNVINNKLDFFKVRNVFSVRDIIKRMKR